MDRREVIMGDLSGVVSAGRMVDARTKITSLERMGVGINERCAHRQRARVSEARRVEEVGVMERKAAAVEGAEEVSEVSEETYHCDQVQNAKMLLRMARSLDRASEAMADDAFATTAMIEAVDRLKSEAHHCRHEAAKLINEHMERRS